MRGYMRPQGSDRKDMPGRINQGILDVGLECNAEVKCSACGRLPKHSPVLWDSIPRGLVDYRAETGIQRPLRGK